MSLLSQMIDSFKSPALKESLFQALSAHDRTLEKDKSLTECGTYKADLYIETEDAVYFVKTFERYRIEPLAASEVDGLADAKKHLVKSKFKRIVPVLIIGRNTQSHGFLEACYRSQAIVLQGESEECAHQLEFILQHQVVPSFQLSRRIEDSAVRFWGL